jgi:AraC family transcriptional regulator
MLTIAEHSVAKKFGLERASTLIARKDTGFPIGFTRLRADSGVARRTLAVPEEEVFSFLVALSPMGESGLSSDGKHRKVAPIEAGETALYDLRTSMVGDFPIPFDYIRFYLPVPTLDQLADERGQRRLSALRMTSRSSRDPVMTGFAAILRSALDQPAPPPALFTDSIAIAVHAHVTHTYGDAPVRERSDRSGLTVRQLRIAQAYIDANLAGDPSIAEMAQECRLSPSHFSRAFKLATGVPPYRWLSKRRIERVRGLLLEGELSLVQIAVDCGFVDQSHMTRSFLKFEGCSPGKWRKMRDHLRPLIDFPRLGTGEAEPLALSL